MGASAALAVMVVAPSASNAGVPGPITVKIGTGAGAAPGCAGVISYDGLPFIGPGALPTGGTIGAINGGSVAVTTDFVKVPPIGAPAASKIDGIVTYPSPVSGNGSIKFSIQQKATSPMGYVGSARMTDSPLVTGTATGKLDAGDLKLSNPSLPFSLTLILTVPNPYGPYSPSGIAAVSLGHVGTSAPGSVLGVSISYMGLPGNCNPTYVQCVILPANGLAPPCV